MNEEKIPIEKVLEDMYNPNGGQVAMSARDYYIHYATNEEKRMMDIEDDIRFIIGCLLLLFFVVGTVICTIDYIIGGF